MSVMLVPLCSIPKLATRDGLTGAFARLLLPGYSFGYWFASGQQYTFPTGTAPQDRGMTVGGSRQANAFVKDAGVCWNP